MRFSWLWLLLCALLACSHAKRPLARRDAAKRADTTIAQGSGEARDPFDFRPADAAASVPAYNELMPPPPEEDAGSSPPPPRTDCFELEPGATLELDDSLMDDLLWQPIEAVPQCPAMHVTELEVAYKPFVLCPSEYPRTVTATMLGADMLAMSANDAVADPLLAAYVDESRLHEDPFDCLAVNDDALFDGLLSNSARIDDLVIPVQGQAVVVASSAERPDQHGLGRFSLRIEVR